jgi:hypothetical protein
MTFLTKIHSHYKVTAAGTLKKIKFAELTSKEILTQTQHATETYLKKTQKPEALIHYAVYDKDGSVEECDSAKDAIQTIKKFYNPLNYTLPIRLDAVMCDSGGNNIIHYVILEIS